MSGRTPLAAVESLVAPLQRAVSCVTNAVLVRDYDVRGRPRAIAFGDGFVPLRGSPRLHFSVILQYSLTGPPASERWTVATTAYWSEFRHAEGRMILAYHWHPIGVSAVVTPHLHFGGSLAGLDLSKAHGPTGHVTVPEIVRFAIDDLGVRPLRDDWQAILAAPVR